MKTEFNSYLWWIFENGQDTTGDFDSSLYGWRTYGDFGLVLNASTRYPTFYAMKLMQYFVQPGDSILNPSSDDQLLAAYAANKTNGAAHPAGHQQGPHQHAHAPDHPKRVLCPVRLPRSVPMACPRITQLRKTHPWRHKTLRPALSPARLPRFRMPFRLIHSPCSPSRLNLHRWELFSLQPIRPLFSGRPTPLIPCKPTLISQPRIGAITEAPSTPSKARTA